MNRNLLLSVLAVFATAGCATASTPELSEKAAERLAGYQPTGKTQSCMTVTQIRQMDAIDDSHFLIEAAGGKKYLNSISGRCSNASRSGYYIEYKVSGSSLCRNDIITVVDNASGMTAGSCGLGDFEELEEAPSADES